MRRSWNCFMNNSSLIAMGCRPPAQTDKASLTEANWIKSGYDPGALVTKVEGQSKESTLVVRRWLISIEELVPESTVDASPGFSVADQTSF